MKASWVYLFVIFAALKSSNGEGRTEGPVDYSEVITSTPKPVSEPEPVSLPVPRINLDDGSIPDPTPRSKKSSHTCVQVKGDTVKDSYEVCGEKRPLLPDQHAVPTYNVPAPPGTYQPLPAHYTQAAPAYHQPVYHQPTPVYHPPPPPPDHHNVVPYQPPNNSHYNAHGADNINFSGDKINLLPTKESYRAEDKPGKVQTKGKNSTETQPTAASRASYDIPASMYHKSDPMTVVGYITPAAGAHPIVHGPAGSSYAYNIPSSASSYGNHGSYVPSSSTGANAPASSYGGGYAAPASSYGGSYSALAPAYHAGGSSYGPASSSSGYKPGSSSYSSGSSSYSPSSSGYSSGGSSNVNYGYGSSGNSYAAPASSYNVPVVTAHNAYVSPYTYGAEGTGHSSSALQYHSPYVSSLPYSDPYHSPNYGVPAEFHSPDYSHPSVYYEPEHHYIPASAPVPVYDYGAHYVPSYSSGGRHPIYHVNPPASSYSYSHGSSPPAYSAGSSGKSLYSTHSSIAVPLTLQCSVKPAPITLQVPLTPGYSSYGGAYGGDSYREDEALKPLQPPHHQPQLQPQRPDFTTKKPDSSSSSGESNEKLGPKQPPTTTRTGLNKPQAPINKHPQQPQPQPPPHQRHSRKHKFENPDGSLAFPPPPFPAYGPNFYQ